MQMTMTVEAINISYGSFTDPESKRTINYANLQALENQEPSESIAGKGVSTISIEGNDKEPADQVATRIHAHILKHGSPTQITVQAGTKLKKDPKTGKSSSVIMITGFDQPK